MVFIDYQGTERERRAKAFNDAMSNFVGGLENIEKSKAREKALQLEQERQDFDQGVKEANIRSKVFELTGKDPGPGFITGGLGSTPIAENEAVSMSDAPRQPIDPILGGGNQGASKLFGIDPREGFTSKIEQRATDQQLKGYQLRKAKREEEEANLPFQETRAGKEFIEKKAIEANAPQKLSANDVQKITEGAVIPNLLTNVEQTIAKNQDLFGPFEGRARSINPYDTRAQTVDAEMRATSQAFGRFMEGGVLRKEDEEKYRKMFPQLSDTPEVARSKLQVVNQLLATKFNASRDALERQGFNVTGIQPSMQVNQPQTQQQPTTAAQDPEAQMALQWAQQNPNDPRSREILNRLQVPNVAGP